MKLTTKQRKWRNTLRVIQKEARRYPWVSTLARQSSANRDHRRRLSRRSTVKRKVVAA